MKIENNRLRRRKYSEIKGGVIYKTLYSGTKFLEDFLRRRALRYSILDFIIAMVASWSDWLDGLYKSAIELCLFFFTFWGLCLLLRSLSIFIGSCVYHPLIAIHPEGIWIGRTYYNVDWGNASTFDVGFIEWGWIEYFQIDLNKNTVYIQMHNIKDIRKYIVRLSSKLTMMDKFISFESVFLISLDFFSIDMFDYIAENELAEIYVKE